ncbi:MAG: homoserine/homoserine lactone efflux protein [Desulfobulbaceae bacterium]|uniref:Homoserine/homoserine lactone efflux protein n=1 Tax=Candidatus Desulfatifera sulfidica TaxID=2841691 RepID=A0A8J6T8L5_9BACT|nr:homoserine/homoserine lactone efflux protein [Candidatus Desulfatifera sulfidica]
MTLDIWLTYLASVIVLSLSPGAGAINTMSCGLRYGVRGTLPAIFGLQMGLALCTLLVGIGLGAIISSSVTLFTFLKWTGACYLIWLGWKKWKDTTELILDNPELEKQAVSTLTLIYRATLINLTNPKAIVFLVALFPIFINPEAPKTIQFLILGSTLIGVDIIVMLGYASLAARLRPLLRNQKAVRLQNRIFGGMFMGAGALLASFKS